MAATWSSTSSGSSQHPAAETNGLTELLFPKVTVALRWTATLGTSYGGRAPTATLGGHPSHLWEWLARHTPLTLCAILKPATTSPLRPSACLTAPLAPNCCTPVLDPGMLGVKGGTGKGLNDVGQHDLLETGAHPAGPCCDALATMCSATALATSAGVGGGRGALMALPQTRRSVKPGSKRASLSCPVDDISSTAP